MGHDKASYLKSLPRQNVRPIFSGIVATGTADLMVIRYLIETDQFIEGRTSKAFRRGFRCSAARATAG